MGEMVSAIVKFIEENPGLQVRRPPRARFVHMRLVEGVPGGVVTVAVSEPFGTDRGLRARFGFAYCTPRDQWDRKRGNRIAEGRMKWDALGTPWEPTVDVVEQAVRQLHAVNVPRWVREAFASMRGA